ncbi:hypothetical protein B0J14DRAFT_558466 [Halenospora varia]|nr:hypothetical protein B0J14DRAFT_558466 [Halenospora varia]
MTRRRICWVLAGVTWNTGTFNVAKYGNFTLNLWKLRHDNSKTYPVVYPEIIIASNHNVYDNNVKWYPIDDEIDIDNAREGSHQFAWELFDENPTVDFSKNTIRKNGSFSLGFNVRANPESKAAGVAITSTTRLSSSSTQPSTSSTSSSSISTQISPSTSTPAASAGAINSGAATVSPTSTNTAAPAPSQAKNIGIGVGIGVLALLLMMVGAWFFMARRKKKKVATHYEVDGGYPVISKKEEGRTTPQGEMPAMRTSTPTGELGTPAPVYTYAEMDGGPVPYNGDRDKFRV